MVILSWGPTCVFMFSLRARSREINSKLIPWVSKGRKLTLKKIQNKILLPGVTQPAVSCWFVKMPGQNKLSDNTPNFRFVVHTGLRVILWDLVKDILQTIQNTKMLTIAQKSNHVLWVFSFKYFSIVLNT